MSTRRTMTTFPGVAVGKLAICLVILGMASLLAMSPASAAGQKPLFNKPVYHAPSKSYFELVKMNTTKRWRNAHAEAAQRTYKGTRGHLAVVDSWDLHEFLRKTFRPNAPTWFGLRYWCNVRKLQWVTGEVLERDQFSIWNMPWDLSDNTGCRGFQGNYMPVFYTPDQRGFRWAAQGIAKFYHYYLVQYPTGEE